MTVMTGFVGRIEDLTLENDDFRRVLYTAPHSQVVVMCLKPLEDIGVETHADIDQFFRIEHGHGEVKLNEAVHPIGPGDAVVVPAGTEHDVTNTSTTEPLQLHDLQPGGPQGRSHPPDEGRRCAR
jgi:mannose-6-phosphate isomerase-like protein (cupin superfamily)